MKTATKEIKNPKRNLREKYFKRTNFREQKLLRISRIFTKSVKACSDIRESLCLQNISKWVIREG